MFPRSALAAALLVAATSSAAGPVTAPTIEWQDGATAAHSLALDVDFAVYGLVAEASVQQRFRNDGERFLNGTYVLPLPEGAAVHTLKLRIGGRVIEGEVREKQQAKSEFEAAAASGQRASLVEQQRANVFRTAVANVAPGETVEVEVGYWQRVAYRDGEFELTFPLSFVQPYSQELGLPESAADAAADRPELAAVGAHDAAPPANAAGAPPEVSLSVELKPGIPIVAIESDTHRISVSPKAGAYTVELSHAVPDRDFALSWKPAATRAPEAALFVEHGKDGDYALAMFMPPTEAASRLPRELILVIDTSGSMIGGAIERAKAALDGALARLAPGDRYNVIEFNSVTRAMHAAPVDATPDSVAAARAWVAALEADGGTEMLPALDRALSNAAAPGHVRQVVFATDGAVTDEEGLYTLIEDALGTSRLFPIGIGDAPNARFIEQAARMGRGTSAVIRDLDDVAAGLDALFAKLDRPAMREVAVSWPGIADAYPRTMPDLYHGEPLVVVAKLPAASGKIAVSGIGGGDGKTAWNRALAIPARDDRGIARLWAKHRVESLEDDLRRGAPEHEVKAAIVSVALEHSLVTRYTSLLAIDRTPARPSGAPVDEVEFANGDALSLAQGATPAPLMFLIGLGGLLTMTMARRRRTEATS